MYKIESRNSIIRTRAKCVSESLENMTVNSLKKRWKSENFIAIFFFFFFISSLSLVIPFSSMAELLCFNLLFLFTLSISFLLQRASASYAGSASSIVNPAKVKQISWSPRYFNFSLFFFFFYYYYNYYYYFLSFHDRLDLFTEPCSRFNLNDSSGLLCMKVFSRI